RWRGGCYACDTLDIMGCRKVVNRLSPLFTSHELLNFTKHTQLNDPSILEMFFMKPLRDSRSRKFMNISCERTFGKRFCSRAKSLPVPPAKSHFRQVHSARSATTGSTLAARIAGRKLASIAA